MTPASAASDTGGTLYEAVLALRDDQKVPALSRFFKTGEGQYGCGDQFLGIKVPDIRKAVAPRWSNCGFDQLEQCIASPYHEHRMAALLALVQRYAHAPKKDPALRQQCVDFYLSHTRFINNWDLVDLSCHEILGDWLLSRDRSLLYHLARHGATLWERRIAIVSTLCFIRHGQVDDTFAIADILLHDPEDLLHKAVGWLLREAGKRDQAALTAFLDTRCTQMPRTMLRYAIEKYPPALRRQYLARKP